MRCLPVKHTPECTHTVCSRCQYVNPGAYTFCTNCGFVLSAANQHLFEQLQQQRLQRQEKARGYIQTGRVALYLLCGFFLVVISYLFGWRDNNYQLLLAGFTLAAFFFLLAKWSLLKPFSALLSGFIVLATLLVGVLFSALAALGHEAPNLHLVFVVIFFNVMLWRGVQGAYQADILADELNSR